MAEEQVTQQAPEATQQAPEATQQAPEAKQKSPEAKQKLPVQMDSTKYILSIVLFAFSYAIIFFIGSAREQIGPAVKGIPVLEQLLPLPMVWDIPTNPLWQISMMHLLLPLIGFWMIFFLVDWMEKFFEEKYAKSIAFPIAFFLVSLAALYVAVYWMAIESSVLRGLTEVSFDFWTELQQSAFYLFVIGGLFGWLSRVIVEKIKI